VSILRGNSLAGIGSHNRRFPLWELGAKWLWKRPVLGNGASFQSRGGKKDLTVTYAGTHEWYTWDPGTQRYIAALADLGSLSSLPLDGRQSAARTNIWTASNSATRGFTYQPGLTIFNDSPLIESNWIINETLLVASDDLRINNSSGGDLRIYQEQALSATLKRIFSVLVKRTDGGVVNTTIVEPYIWDPATGYAGPNLSNWTSFKKIRSDGWYEVQAYIDADALTPTRRFGLVVHDGAHVYLEAPQLESGSASYLECTDRVPTTTTADRTREQHDISCDGSLSESGWMACCFIPRWNNAGGGVPSVVNSTLLEIVGAPTDYHKLYWSSANQEFAYTAYSGGVNRAYHQIPTTTQGVAYGFVASWGYREGVPYYMSCTNGSFQEINTTDPIPVLGSATVRFLGSTGPSAPANCQVFAVAVGDHLLHRTDVRSLSRWFQRQALGNIS
jgi:hypothetical protein